MFSQLLALLKVRKVRGRRHVLIKSGAVNRKGKLKLRGRALLIAVASPTPGQRSAQTDARLLAAGAAVRISSPTVRCFVVSYASLVFTAQRTNTL